MTEAAQKKRDELYAKHTEHPKHVAESHDYTYKSGFDAGYSTAKLEAEELIELLESVRGWVYTHAMQTYSKLAQKDGERIDEALARYRGERE